MMKRHALLGHSRTERIFDHGFGLGLMLFCFPRQCFLAGYELSESAVRLARAAAQALGFQSTDLRVFHSGEVVPAQWAHSFDLVISSHVLEHIADPGAALKQLALLIKAGGHICIIVPINEKPGEDQNHYSHFTAGSILKMLSDEGLEVTDSASVDRLYWLIKPLSMARQRKDTWQLMVMSKIVNGCLSPIPNWMLRIIDSILGRLEVPPTQFMVLARKRIA